MTHEFDQSNITGLLGTPLSRRKVIPLAGAIALGLVGFETYELREQQRLVEQFQQGALGVIKDLIASKGLQALGIEKFLDNTDAMMALAAAGKLQINNSQEGDQQLREYVITHEDLDRFFVVSDIQTLSADSFFYRKSLFMYFNNDGQFDPLPAFAFPSTKQGILTAAKEISLIPDSVTKDAIEKSATNPGIAFTGTMANNIYYPVDYSIFFNKDYLEVDRMAATPTFSA